jgi:hypothetical protein
MGNAFVLGDFTLLFLLCLEEMLAFGA